MQSLTSFGHHWREVFVSLAVVAAYVTALFFNGTNLEVLSLTLGLLIISLACSLWWSSPAGLKLPRTSLLVTMLLYWAWLAATLTWNPVAYVGTTVSFWWQSILPMGFVIIVLMAARAQVVWSYLSVFILLAGLGLVLHGAYQAFVLNQPPRSLFLDANMYAATLNLIALPTAGYLLLRFLPEKIPRSMFAALTVAFFLLVYGVMITRSRGAILTLFIGLGLLAAYTYRHVPRRALITVLALVLLAYASAELSQQGAIVTRLGTLSDPAGASAERLLIWQQSWELLRQSPWWGAGVGLYPLVWARYRHPEDGNAGYFAHNDYLQLWIEAGLPGLILFLAVLVSATWLFVRTMRNRYFPTIGRVEVAGLFAGLSAIALHALIEFPFYIAPILVVYGLMLARIQFLATSLGQSEPWVIRPLPNFSRGGFRVIIAATALLPLAYFASIAMSSFDMQRGVDLAAQGRLDEADEVLERAMRFRPNSDSVLIARADLRRHILVQDPALGAQQKMKLFEDAGRLLARAEQLNPLRPVTFLVRAELYRLNPALAGAQWRNEVERSYQTSLERNPRFYPARYLYGRFVLGFGDVSRARRILDEGASYTYAEDPQVAPYLLLTAALRELTGDVHGAETLRKRLVIYLTRRGDQNTFRPNTQPTLLVPDFAGPPPPTKNQATRAMKEVDAVPREQPR